MTDYDQGFTEVVEGCTDPIKHTLKDAGATFNATGMTLSAVCKDKTGAVVDVSALIAWDDATVSRAKLTPLTTTFDPTKSPYRLHWKVTNGSAVIPFPKGQAREIRVAKAGGA